MKQNTMFRWAPLCILAILLLQSGCASKIPSSLPLVESEKPFVLDQLQEFQSRKCIQSLDADVTLEWEMFGKSEKIPGMLQLQSPAFLRYAVVDPLGRQLLILVSDGSSFSLVDNSKAKALTGQVDSDFWNKYIPDFITSMDYMAWLTGRLPAETLAVKDIRADNTYYEAVWLITRWKNSKRHHILFFPNTGQVTRHIVEAKYNDILLDITYSDYQPNGRKCAIPHMVMVEGAEISGTVTVHFDEILPEKQIPENIFHLTLPDHFTVKTVD